MPDSALIPTDISGLDTLFLGGIRRGNLILVEGVPGSGKSLLGLEFIYRGATVYNEPGLGASSSTVLPSSERPTAPRPRTSSTAPGPTARCCNSSSTACGAST